MNPASFPAEYLLQIVLPNWEWELLRLNFLLAAAAILWLLGLPWALSSSFSVVAKAASPKAFETKKWSIPWYAGVLGLVGFLVTAAALLAFASPYNVYSSRRVYNVPVLTADECIRIIHMAFAASKSNVKLLSDRSSDDLDELEAKVLEDPAGWQKMRHENYPTTDLDLSADPFTAEDIDWLRQIADQRLAPILSRIYGIPARSIQARDMFVVRYDADKERSKLAKHTDGGDISFTIFLNNAYEGGGTQFWNRYTKEPFALVQSNTAGLLSTFPSRIQHEGYPTTEGRRMILVGFLNVVRFDEDGTTPTGLSLAASWGNVNWAMVRIRAAYSNYEWGSDKIRRMAYRAILTLQAWHDRLSVHAAVPSLVKQEQLLEFLDVLDTHYNDTNPINKAKWLQVADQWDEENNDEEEYDYDAQEERDEDNYDTAEYDHDAQDEL